MTPKLGQNQISELKETQKINSFLTKWVDVKTVFETYHYSKNSPFGTQKVKNDLKIKSKVNVRIERNKANESCSTTWVDTKTVVESDPTPKNGPLWPQKVKNVPEIK